MWIGGPLTPPGEMDVGVLAQHALAASLFGFHPVTRALPFRRCISQKKDLVTPAHQSVLQLFIEIVAVGVGGGWGC